LFSQKKTSTDTKGALSTLHSYITGSTHIPNFIEPRIMNGSTNAFKFEPLDEETLNSGAEG